MLLATTLCFLVICSSIYSSDQLKRTTNFKNMNRSSYFLSTNEPWIPGSMTLIAVLMSMHPLPLHVLFSRTIGSVEIKVLNLLFKCAPQDSNFKTISLLPATELNATFCSNLQPFSVVQVNPYMFNLTLLQVNRIPFNQSLSHHLEFKVAVQLDLASLESHSLFVFNFDSLTKLNTSSSSRYREMDFPFDKNILSDQAVEFLTQFNLFDRQAINSSGSIQFLNSKFVELVNNAPFLIRSLLCVTVYYRNMKSECGHEYEADMDFVIASGNAVGLGQSPFKQEKGFMLSLETGQLVYSAGGILDIVTKMNPYDEGIFICLRISISNSIWKYYISHKLGTTASPLFSSTETALTAASTEKRTCRIVGGIKHLAISLPANMHNISIVYPILCPQSVAISVTFNGRSCKHGITPDGRVSTCGDHVALPLDGNAITLIGPTSVAHAGSYVISSATFEFTIVVTVVSLPIVWPASLTYEDFVNTKGQSAITCTVIYSGVQDVSIMPNFQVRKWISMVKWRTISVDDFGIDVLKTGPSGVGMVKSHTNTTTMLRAMLPPPEKTCFHWQYVYTCQVIAHWLDAQKFGLPHYSVDASSDFEYCFGSKNAAINSSNGLSPIRSEVHIIILVIVAVSLYH